MMFVVLVVVVVVFAFVVVMDTSTIQGIVVFIDLMADDTAN